MFSQRLWQQFRGAKGATAIALLAFAVLVPTRADASCGDYVMVGSHSAQMGHAPAGDEQLPSDTNDGSQAPWVPRCHGARCSNNSFPPAAPAPKIEVMVERWAVSADALFLSLPARDEMPPDARVNSCAGFRLGILRPPR